MLTTTPTKPRVGDRYRAKKGGCVFEVCGFDRYVGEHSALLRVAPGEPSVNVPFDQLERLFTKEPRR